MTKRDIKVKRTPLACTLFVSAWAGELSLILSQEKVDEKSNEIKAIPELLKKLAIEGCTVTIDAMGTQKKIAEQIIDKKADYILQVKGNQETLEREIAEYFEEECFQRRKRILRKPTCIIKKRTMTTGA